MGNSRKRCSGLIGLRSRERSKAETQCHLWPRLSRKECQEAFPEIPDLARNPVSFGFRVLQRPGGGVAPGLVAANSYYRKVGDEGNGWATGTHEKVPSVWSRNGFAAILILPSQRISLTGTTASLRWWVTRTATGRAPLSFRSEPTGCVGERKCKNDA